MLEIDKEKLNLKYNSGDMEYFFIEANKITDYVLSRNFNVRDEDKRADMVQECLLNLWKKVKQGKVKGHMNLMSFIWQNSTFRALEIFRKENNRNRIAQFTSFDSLEGDYLEYEFLGKEA